MSDMYVRDADESCETLRSTAIRSTFGAFNKTELIGVASVQCHAIFEQRYVAHIWGVFVARHHRNTGVAKLLLAAAIAYAKSMQDVTCISLSVAADNVAAINLYRSLGFRETGSIFDDPLHEDVLQMGLFREATDAFDSATSLPAR